uniref:Uncharacterized protein n=1 Tax=Rhizophora mucronata TaxID=61149 RepID=A0A2P2PF52_RHIMU
MMLCFLIPCITGRLKPIDNKFQRFPAVGLSNSYHFFFLLDLMVLLAHKQLFAWKNEPSQVKRTHQ